MPLKASTLAVLAFGTVAVLVPGLPCVPETGAANAAEIYTRKRVNGRWITGRFPKADGRRGAARHRLAGRGTRALAARAVPDPVSPPRTTAAAAPAVPERVISTASLTPVAEPPRLEHMRSALEARARSLASGPTGAAPLPADVAGPAPDVAVPEPEGVVPPPRLTPRSITFDLDRGTKTVTFDDGAVVSEPFDRTRIRELAGRPSAVSGR